MKLKLMSTIFKFILLLKILFIFITSSVFSEETFDSWLISYKNQALKKGISQETLNTAFKNVKFLDQVIKYDRKQPEFYEDTLTYVGKRANDLRVKKARILFNKNQKLFNEVEKNFFVEKEILLALWGIETNFGKHVGKMDIISSLATLSYDKRRREFFSSQLFTLLKLIDDQVVDVESLYGSWAGAFGNFQFMPSSIKSYALDYDNNSKIELRDSLPDALASAANYINRIGWKYNDPCFIRVKFSKEIKNKLINTSARNINNRLRASKWKDIGLVPFNNNEVIKFKGKAALILPDNKPNTPAYLVFHNYEKILHWNRSLRFGISVCTLANKIKI